MKAGRGGREGREKKEEKKEKKKRRKNRGLLTRMSRMGRDQKRPAKTGGKYKVLLGMRCSCYVTCLRVLKGGRKS